MQLDPARAEFSAPLVAPMLCAPAMMALARPQLPLRAALFAACGAWLRAAWLQVAFFVASVQRAKLLAAPDTFPALAAAMQE